MIQQNPYAMGGQPQEQQVDPVAQILSPNPQGDPEIEQMKAQMVQAIQAGQVAPEQGAQMVQQAQMDKAQVAQQQQQQQAGASGGGLGVANQLAEQIAMANMQQGQQG